MQIIQTNNFRRIVKKLHANQKSDLDTALSIVLANPEIGILKTADLLGMRVYKFKMNKQPVLMTYNWDALGNTITLLALGSHEKFYRGLKAK